MAPPKIVLHSITGYRPELIALVHSWIERGIKYVGVFGKDASRLDDVIDEICVGDGSNPYEMLTAFHDPSEGLNEAVTFANEFSSEFGEGVEIVEF